MHIELINTGSELLLGRVLNTHQQWLGRRLCDLGYPVGRIECVSDSGPEIAAAVARSLNSADLVITTGGLGPTADDRTRDELAALLGLELREDPEVVAGIHEHFARRGKTPPPSTLVQARVPHDSRVLLNSHGTAPGLVIHIPAGRFREAPAWLVMLPGPPRELRPMFDGHVVPWLAAHLPPPRPFRCRTLRTTGMGESRVEEIVQPALAGEFQEGLQIGYCARSGEVDVRLVATGPDAANLVDRAETKVRDLLKEHVFGETDDSLESAVVAAFRATGKTLVTAESCTGGLLAHRITNVPGASEVFVGGLVTYSNAMKRSLLGVREVTLEAHGAVSEEAAREMAEGARERYHADVAAAVTGIAGPGGGTPEKPVGTVFLAVADRRGTTCGRQLNALDRETFKHITTQQTLEMLRRAVAQ